MKKKFILVLLLAGFALLAATGVTFSWYTIAAAVENAPANPGGAIRGELSLLDTPWMAEGVYKLLPNQQIYVPMEVTNPSPADLVYRLTIPLYFNETVQDAIDSVAIVVNGREEEVYPSGGQSFPAEIVHFGYLAGAAGDDIVLVIRCMPFDVPKVREQGEINPLEHAIELISVQAQKDAVSSVFGPSIQLVEDGQGGYTILQRHSGSLEE